jgi:hypothetical protein
VLRGFFATEPTRVSFEMDFIPNDGEWKLIRINVKVAPSADGAPVPEPAPERSASQGQEDMIILRLAALLAALSLATAAMCAEPRCRASACWKHWSRGRCSPSTTPT